MSFWLTNANTKRITGKRPRFALMIHDRHYNLHHYNDRDYHDCREDWEQRGYHDYRDHRKHLEYHGHYA